MLRRIALLEVITVTTQDMDKTNYKTITSDNNNAHDNSNGDKKH